MSLRTTRTSERGGGAGDGRRSISVSWVSLDPLVKRSPIDTPSAPETFFSVPTDGLAVPASIRVREVRDRPVCAANCWRVNPAVAAQFPKLPAYFSVYHDHELQNGGE